MRRKRAVGLPVFSSMPMGCECVEYKEFGGSAGERPFIKEYGHNLHPSAHQGSALDYSSTPPSSHSVASFALLFYVPTAHPAHPVQMW